MTAKTLLNGEPVSYLIHGQPFTLEIEAEDCLFLVVRYDSGSSPLNRWSVRKRKTVFQSVTNAYRPTIQVWGVGRGVRKIFEKRLNVNFINVLNQDPLLKTLQPRILRRPVFERLLFKAARPHVRIETPKPTLKFPGPMKTAMKALSLDRCDDWRSFKESQPKAPE
jgi:hypothetical protein